MKTNKGYSYLTPEEKSYILFLRESMGYNFRTISEMTNRSESTVKRLVYHW